MADFETNNGELEETPLDPQIRKAINVSIFEGAFYTGFFLLSQGFLLTSLGLYFNASELILSLAFALPVAFQFFQLFTPFILDRIKSRKKIVVVSSLISRLPWIVLAVAVSIGLRDAKLFLYMFMISQIALTFAGNAWNSWIRDLVPENLRGRFFGIRNLGSSLVTIFATLLYSNILDAVVEPYNYLLVISIGLIFGFLSLGLLTIQYEPPSRVFGALAGLKACLKDANFRKFMFYAFLWNFAIYVSAPYFTLYQIRFLKLSYSIIGFYSILSGAVALPAYYIWGTTVDKYGSKVVAQIGIFTVSWLPFLWLFMAESTMRSLLPIDAITAGIGWAAVNLAVFSLAFEVAGFHSSAYFSLFFSSVAFGSIAGSLAGGYLGEIFVDKHFSFIGFDFEGIKLMFLTSGTLRIASLFVLRKVKVRKYEKPRIVVQAVLAAVGRKMIAVPRYAGQAVQSGIKKAREREKRSS